VNAARVIEGEVIAYLGSYGRPEHLRGTPAEALESLCFSTSPNMGDHGWTRVGKATVTVEIVDEKSIFENKVASLRAEKAQVMAKATAEATEIERKIQTLLAITFEGEAA